MTNVNCNNNGHKIVRVIKDGLENQHQQLFLNVLQWTCNSATLTSEAKLKQHYIKTVSGHSVLVLFQFHVGVISDGRAA